MKKKYLMTYTVLSYWTLTKFAEIGKLENSIAWQIETEEWIKL
jgi:hypothetical protein